MVTFPVDQNLFMLSVLSSDSQQQITKFINHIKS